MYNFKFLRNVLLAALVALTTLFTSAMGTAVSLAKSEQEFAQEESRADILVLRSAYSKTYILPDNTYQTVVSAEPVHYQDTDGYFKDIENTIVDETKTLKSTSYKHKNAANAYTARFGDMSGTLPVLMEYGGNSVGFRPVGARDAVAQKGRATNALKSVVPDENAMTYYDVYPGVDMVYESAISGLKEYIVLKRPGTPNEFEFDMELNGLRIQEKAGTIKLEDETGAELLEITGLMAFDANGEATDKVGCEVLENEGKYRIRVTLDEDYLAAKDRAYPVVIDPSVMITGSNSTFDTFVSSAKPNTNYYMNNYLRLGYDSTYKTQRTYIRFNLPTSISASHVTSAKLRMKMYSGDTIALRAYRVTGSWTPKTMTWNNKPGYAAESVGVMDADGTPWYKIVITDQVKKWLNKTHANNGLLLKRNNESGSATVFYSSDAPSPNKPELIINHTGTTFYGARGYLSLPKTDDYNCMGYAINKKGFIDFPTLELYPGTVSTSESQFFSLVKSHSEKYMREHGVKFRQINSYNSSINSNEYVVVMRAAYWDRDGNKRVTCSQDLQNPDAKTHEDPTFHWMYRTNTGVWASKNGGNASETLPGITDPQKAHWFDSKYTLGPLIYYAITL